MLTQIWQDPHQGKVRFTLEEGIDYKKFSPCTQSYGFCFNKEGKLLIGRCSGVINKSWVLPGGTIEAGEDPVMTLHRELDEEVSISVKKEMIIGIQKIEFLEQETSSKYQLRFACLIDELKELTPDPDNGHLWERKFIDADTFLQYVPWGLIGEELLKRAKNWFEKEISK